MDTKLTLKLNQEIIEKAKRYAAEKNVSLSRLIENYLNSLTTGRPSTGEIKVSGFVKSLSSKINIPADFDYKEDHSAYLENKHK